MALIKCPECGRENVSDAATSCPSCGYNIQKYFDKISKEEQEAQRKIEQDKLNEKIEKMNQLREQERFDAIQFPPKPKYPIAAAIIGALIMPISVLNRSLFLFLCSIVIIAYSAYIYSERCARYDLAEFDFDLYRQQIINREDAYQKKQLAEKQAVEKAPKCPHCGSHNIKSISTANRIVSIGMTGLASSKIGKQFICKQCKYKW